MKNILLAISILIIALSINSCSKADCSSDNIFKGGLINVNINGVSCDSIPVRESFCADKYTSTIDQDAYVYDHDDYRSFTIKRIAGKDWSDKSISIVFDEKENVVTKCEVIINYFKLLDNNTILYLYLHSWPMDTEISNFSFDETNGTLKGDFNVNFYCPVVDTTRTITASGDFNVHVTKILDKK
jgi:hypothetical protein